MSNKSYLKGVRLERKTKVRLEEQGFLVMRSAGSHGIDIVATDAMVTYWISCKYNKPSKNEKEAFFATYLPKVRNGDCVMIVYTRNGHVYCAARNHYKNLPERPL